MMYLVHHGILGQKWGVRRFQNPDGTLTEAGRRRLKNDSGKAIYKHLKKEFRNERAKQYGGSNRWIYDNEIGENGKRLREAEQKNYRQYVNSEAYKNYQRKWDELDRQLEEGKIDVDEYDALSNDLFKTLPAKGYDPIDSGYRVTSLTGREYLEKDFLRKGGRDISIARLQDLGYSEEVAKALVDKMVKEGYTLAMI